MKPQTNKVNFDEFVEDYNQELNKNTAFFSEDDSYFAKYKVDLIGAQTRIHPKKILEYGAGIGRNIPFLKEIFPNAEIWACDISEKSIEELNRCYPYAKTFSLKSDLSQLAGQFDLVFVAGVYHHVQPVLRAEVTQQLAKLLQPKGEIFVFEHNPYNFVTRKLVERCIYDADAIMLKPKELNALLQQVGLKPKPVYYYLFFPPKLKLRRIEPCFKKLPMGGQYFIQASF